VQARQLRSPLLLVQLGVTALASYFFGRVDALIIAVIRFASLGLGIVNEFRAERSGEGLHSQLRHTCIAWRDARPVHKRSWVHLTVATCRSSLGSGANSPAWR
jgi:Mg2+-importing ATPase